MPLVVVVDKPLRGKDRQHPLGDRRLHLRYMGKAEKLNITLPGHLLARIDAHVKNHPEHKSRSGFLAEAALRVLQHG